MSGLRRIVENGPTKGQVLWLAGWFVPLFLLGMQGWGFLWLIAVYSYAYYRILRWSIRADRLEAASKKFELLVREEEGELHGRNGA